MENQNIASLEKRLIIHKIIIVAFFVNLLVWIAAVIRMFIIYGSFKSETDFKVIGLMVLLGFTISLVCLITSLVSINSLKKEMKNNVVTSKVPILVILGMSILYLLINIIFIFISISLLQEVKPFGF